MSTTIKTAKAKYTVHSLHIPLQGTPAIVVKQPSGKTRKLTVKDVGRPRFQAAVSHFLAEKRAEVILGQLSN